MNKIIKNALILMAITLTAGLALGGVYSITKDPIARQEQKTKEEAYKTVCSQAAVFDAVEDFSKEAADQVLMDAGYSAQHIDEVLLAKDESGAILGAVMNVTTSEVFLLHHVILTSTDLFK